MTVAEPDVIEPSTPRTETEVTYVIGTYPLLTTTFIDREIRMMRRLGTTVHVVSLRRPSHDMSPEQAALASATSYMRPVAVTTLAGRHLRFLLRRPVRYVSTLARLVFAGGQSPRERLRTAGHFGLAVHVAGELEQNAPGQRIHAHFIDRAATVAYVASRLLDVPYSITAHASDIYVDPVLLDLKIGGAEFVATCTDYNVDHLVESVAAAPTKVERVYHGLELQNYEPSPAAPEASSFMILAVGQLKEKKGYIYLLEACALLAAKGIDFHCEIVGEGPKREALEGMISELGLQERVRLRGALPHDQVIAAYRRAHVFVLPCLVAENGDRDGIPNVILEAMAMQLPVVSTTHSGIPEAVVDGTTGLLVPPGDSGRLANALETVLSDPCHARQMGVEGRAVVMDQFDTQRNVEMFRERFLAGGG